MNGFLRLLGLDGAFVENLGSVRLGVQWPWVLGIGLALWVPIVIWAHRRQDANLPTIAPRVRNSLTLLRALVLLLLVVVLAGPVARLDLVDKRRPLVAFVLDRSRSMELPAGPFATSEEGQGAATILGKPPETGTREELAIAALKGKAETLLKPLMEKYEVRGHVVGGGLSPWDLTKLEVPASAPSEASRQGEALIELIEESGGREVAGIVLLTDGQVTDGRSLAEAGRTAAEARAPVIAVPIGGSARLKDVAIVETFSSGEATVDDTVVVAVTIESQGFDGRTVPVELREGDELLDTKQVTLSSTEQQQIELTFKAKTAGLRYLNVVVPSPDDEAEALRSNNSDLTAVRVSDEKVKTLIVEGGPRWDFRFLKNAVRRDNGLAGLTADSPDLVLETEAARRGGVGDGLPRDVEELSKYNVIVLGDASPALLNEEFMKSLVTAVREKGVGLIVGAGPRAMPHAYGSDFRELLPVAVDPEAPGREAPVYSPYRMELTADGAIHEATRFYDDPVRNQRLWSEMPEYYWQAAVTRPAPAATVLVRNPAVTGDYGALPLVAHHYAGSGKVMFLATDSTWLWRRYVGERFFAKFWGQSLRFVARKSEGAGKRGTLEVRPLRARPGERVQVELRAVGPEGKALEAEKVAITVEKGEGGDVKALSATRDGAAPGRFLAPLAIEKPGDYVLNYETGDGGPPLEARFRVLEASEELRRPNVDRAGLRALSTATGSRSLEVQDLDQLPDLLKGEPKSVTVHREAPIWDNPLVLGLLIALYCLDVAIRRLSGLS